jgi:hypothetical protein
MALCDFSLCCCCSQHLKKRRAAANPEVVTGGDQDEPMQVLLRLQISRPGRRPLINSLQLAMAGALLNVKTDSTDELMNWTVDTVSVQSHATCCKLT